MENWLGLASGLPQQSVSQEQQQQLPPPQQAQDGQMVHPRGGMNLGDYDMGGDYGSMPGLALDSNANSNDSQNQHQQQSQQNHNNNAVPGAHGATDFVNKLFAMLEEPGFSHVVRWTESGESFVVLDTSEFTKVVLPRHFKHSNFSSFVRQLNKYDFHKVRSNNADSSLGETVWEFKHPDFLRNKQGQMENIRRKLPAKKTGKANTGGASSGGAGSTASTEANSNANGVKSEEVSNLQQQLNEVREQNEELSSRVGGLQSQLALAIEAINALEHKATSRDQTIAELRSMILTGSNQSSPQLQYNQFQPQPSNGFNVLLVVDEENAARACRGMIQEYSPGNVDVTDDGFQAVERVKQCAYDFVLIDSVIKKLDGVSAARSMRKFTTSPIIIMTESTQYDANHYYRNGVSDVLAKPFGKSALFSVLSQNWDKHGHKRRRGD